MEKKSELSSFNYWLYCFIQWNFSLFIAIVTIQCLLQNFNSKIWPFLLSFYHIDILYGIYFRVNNVLKKISLPLKFRLMTQVRINCGFDEEQPIL